MFVSFVEQLTHPNGDAPLHLNVTCISFKDHQKEDSRLCNACGLQYAKEAVRGRYKMSPLEECQVYGLLEKGWL